MPPRGVRAMRVSLAHALEQRAFTGVVAARFETPLAFRAGGRIVDRLVDVGMVAKAGTPLLRLDPADHEIALRAARARLSIAEAQRRQANAEEARQASLLARGWSTEAAYERALAASRSADDQAAAAAEDVKLAQNRLGYTTLSAPHDGVVTSLSAEAGQVVAEGQPVLVLARPEEREAVVAIPEGQVADLASWSAKARLWRAGQDMEAQLREVSPQADAVSRTFRARFTLAQGHRADLGATVTIHFSRPVDRPAAAVPASALDMRDGRPAIWVVNGAGDRAAPRSVSLVSLGAVTATVHGLADGDLIVTLGVHRLDATLPIRVVEQTASAWVAPDAASGGRAP
jgi:RND family efflux transporter MFP subunit